MARCASWPPVTCTMWVSRSPISTLRSPAGAPCSAPRSRPKRRFRPRACAPWRCARAVDGSSSSSPTGADTPVGRFLERRGEGMHHVAFGVDDVVAELARVACRRRDPRRRGTTPGPVRSGRVRPSGDDGRRAGRVGGPSGPRTLKRRPHDGRASAIRDRIQGRRDDGWRASARSARTPRGGARLQAAAAWSSLRAMARTGSSARTTSRGCVAASAIASSASARREPFGRARRAAAAAGGSYALLVR